MNQRRRPRPPNERQPRRRRVVRVELIDTYDDKMTIGTGLDPACDGDVLDDYDTLRRFAHHVTRAVENKVLPEAHDPPDHGVRVVRGFDPIEFQPVIVIEGTHAAIAAWVDTIHAYIDDYLASLPDPDEHE